MSHTLFIIFGSTGDLAKRKLFPALYEIFRKKEQEVQILAVGRRDFTLTDFRSYLDSETEDFIQKGNCFHDFLSTIEYQKVEVTQGEDYIGLKEKIGTLSHEDIQVIFYLSIAPEFFRHFIRHYSVLELPRTTRVVFEKPFGTDLESSHLLNNEITEVFDEEQIYRIDHYVGKEAIQNIFALRFANTIFEPLWNKTYIDNIQITASESIGVGNRGGYYDASGALRDMVQNHLLQVLSLVTMDAPRDLSDESIRMEKLRLFEHLRLDSDFARSVVFGQYRGYREEIGVAPDSRTETFVALRLEIATDRWKGVPIYLKTGKALEKKLTQIVIEFREAPFSLFERNGTPERNRLVIDIQPDETIRIDFNVKEVGNSKKIRKVEGVFENTITGKEAYEKLIEDVVIGDKTLFTSFRMLEETWRIIDDLVNCKDNCPMIYEYEPGSKGPTIANNIFPMKI